MKLKVVTSNLGCPEVVTDEPENIRRRICEFSNMEDSDFDLAHLLVKLANEKNNEREKPPPPPITSDPEQLGKII